MKNCFLTLILMATAAQADDMGALERICKKDLEKGPCQSGQGVLTLRCLATQSGLEAKCHEAITEVVNNGRLPKAEEPTKEVPKPDLKK